MINDEDDGDSDIKLYHFAGFQLLSNLPVLDTEYIHAVYF